ncbi:MAG: hypothetical protein QUS08_00790 [Methanothrix sp.]|nr:hypothetical protein [Methanothrix sp.]
MRLMLIAAVLMVLQASATVEDTSGSTWAVPSLPAVPSYLPDPCQEPKSSLTVEVGAAGPGSDREKLYTTQGRPLDFTVTVCNDGSTGVEAEVAVNPGDCALDWFSWTTTMLEIPAGSSRSLTLQVTPAQDSVAGRYEFEVGASARCRTSGKDRAGFIVQALDYASETMVSGTGQFQISKDVRSMSSGIKSSKNVLFSGSVDALVNNEYLVDQAKGRNANFQEEDAVDNYNAVMPGDALLGTESFRSSIVFGGVGARVQESYDVSQMEFKLQDFTLHQTGSLKKTAEFRTADNFTGYYLIDAKQTIPGQRGMKEHEEYLGSFEISRRILFRDATKPRAVCQEADCAVSPAFPSPCSTGSCSDFVRRLNAFTQSA